MNEKKYDKDKPMAGLMIADFSRALIEISKVSTYGCKKYGSHSGWQNVTDDPRRYKDAMCRHLLSEASSETDEESGLLHAAHFAWNCLAILELKLIEAELNG